MFFRILTDFQSQTKTPKKRQKIDFSNFENSHQKNWLKLRSKVLRGQCWPCKSLPGGSNAPQCRVKGAKSGFASSPISAKYLLKKAIFRGDFGAERKFFRLISFFQECCPSMILLTSASAQLISFPERSEMAPKWLKWMKSKLF